MAIKVVFCLRRRQGMSREEFQAYWLEQHAPLVRRLAAATGMSRYVQSHTVTSRLGISFAKARGISAEPYDGVMEGWWDSEAQALAALAVGGAEAGPLLLADESRFIDLENSPIFFTEEHEIFGSQGPVCGAE